MINTVWSPLLKQLKKQVSSVITCTASDLEHEKKKCYQNIILRNNLYSFFSHSQLNHRSNVEPDITYVVSAGFTGPQHQLSPSPARI